jgi:hypothetical protein
MSYADVVKKRVFPESEQLSCTSVQKVPSRTNNSQRERKTARKRDKRRMERRMKRFSNTLGLTFDEWFEQWYEADEKVRDEMEQKADLALRH